MTNTVDPGTADALEGAEDDTVSGEIRINSYHSPQPQIEGTHGWLMDFGNPQSKEKAPRRQERQGGHLCG